jgi:hypothetical protein
MCVFLQPERSHRPSGLDPLAGALGALALFRRRSARLWTFEPGVDEEIRVEELAANDDGLFDVTELKLV